MLEMLIFYDFIHQLQLIIDESGDKLLRLLAVQVALFPGRGICIGVTNHHYAGDASPIGVYEVLGFNK
ncbi:UNVERIFIED_CONTAM: Anthocyanidin 3-O-glucoside 6''-O-acyltransferase [Sesamum angustifolium]|uniref:Anthocyanidin 3-O-glucoside 6''-O-acyltransferase n=1 Tax=Sesamum angustifolium TaxID=2727405 RepID=A0AAW2JNM9_9LAMI